MLKGNELNIVLLSGLSFEFIHCLVRFLVLASHLESPGPLFKGLFSTNAQQTPREATVCDSVCVFQSLHHIEVPNLLDCLPVVKSS